MLTKYTEDYSAAHDQLHVNKIASKTSYSTNPKDNGSITFRKKAVLTQILMP